MQAVILYVSPSAGYVPFNVLIYIYIYRYQTSLPSFEKYYLLIGKILRIKKYIENHRKMTSKNEETIDYLS